MLGKIKGRRRRGQLLGSSPGGSREFEGGDGVGVLGNNLFNYRQRGIRKLAEKKRLNNLVHMEYQSPPTQAAGRRRLPVLLKERRH